jgi:D-alanine-D-alanine ligase
MTFDLRSEYLAQGLGAEETAEFDSGATIDALEGALRQLGHEPVRIGNVRALVRALADGQSWDLVFNVCEGLKGYGREAQVPGLLEAYGIAYTFADPLVACLTLHKVRAKQILRDCGVPVAPWRLVDRVEDCDTIGMSFPLFVKPVAEGTAKGILPTSKVLTPTELKREVKRVLDTYHQPALVEPFLSGREYTTGLVGEGASAEVIGTIECRFLAGKADAEAATFLNKEECESRMEYLPVEPAVAERCAEIALAAWRALGCRDAGRVDLRADGQGRIVVLELNPLPGLHPTHSDLPMICTQSGFPYLELVRRIVDAAAARRQPSQEGASPLPVPPPR